MDASSLPQRFRRFIALLWGDLDTVVQRDPATPCHWEALLCVPGVLALWLHRVAHAWQGWGIPLLPRFLSRLNLLLTGIEIHPAARVGERVFFDHSGAIVGESTIIGDDVTLIGRVCLGANGREGQTHRHPVVGNGVSIGMDAILLGPIHVGDNAFIGAQSVVTKDVPAEATVVGSPARLIRLGSERVQPPRPLA